MSSIGNLFLDLNLNTKPFDAQISNVGNYAQKSMTKSFGGIGKIVAGALSVAAIGAFGKSCIDLGSDLAEVQNVVDVVFPSMNAQVNNFSKNAIASFGLSETQAKRMVGTFGAMSKAFGFSESQAYGMSTALTGLAGDVASFYNISGDEAYTKLKSVFSGETETLKDLGIVMTQSALDQYALANGYAKTTAKMSEQEKVALRLDFVTQQLNAAGGDFARTADSWANKTRVLSLNFQSLKASIGQGLISVLSPIVSILNNIIVGLNKAVQYFVAFTSLLSGKKVNSSLGSVSSSIDKASSGASNLTDNVAGVGKAAKKTAKEMGALAGIDEINNISTSKSDSSSGSGGPVGGDFGSGTDVSGVVDTIDTKVFALQKRIGELATIFNNGFKEGFGKDFEASLQRTQQQVGGIGKSLTDIFTDRIVVSAANNWANKVTEEIGRVIGATANVGATIAENFTGGVGKYLQQNGGFIKKRIVGMLDASSETHELSGKYAAAFSNIFEVFRSDKAKQITADIVGVFSNGFLGSIELGIKFGRDIQRTILGPIIENKDKIKTALENTLAPIQTVTSSISDMVTNTFDHMNSVYDEKVKPAFDKIAAGLSSILGTALDLYNQYIAPVLQGLADKFALVMSEYIQPAISKVIDFVGKLANAIGELWQNVVAPFINWCMETLIPILAPIFETLGTIILDLLGRVAQVVGGIFEFLGGLIDFIVGVFTGDWKLAWEGIKSMFGGIWNAILGIVTAVWDTIKLIVTTAINIVKGIIETVLKVIAGVFTVIWDTIKGVVLGTVNFIKDGISSGLNGAKDIVTNVLNGISNVFKNVFNGIWKFIKGIINSIIGGIESLINGVIGGLNGMIKAMNKLSFDVPGWVPVIGGNKFGFDLGNISKVNLPKLANGGYVEANTPQLAMIGDNRHQGEIVAPEGKMFEVMISALESYLGKHQGEIGDVEVIVSILYEILEAIKGMRLVVDSESLNRSNKDKELERSLRTGKLVLK